MPRTHQLISGLLALGLVLAGCGDDDGVELDAALPDADRDDARAEDAEVDARVEDAEMDATADAELDAAEMDAPVDAGAAMFAVILTPEAEVPPCEEAAQDAAGSATVTVASDNSAIEVTDLEFEGLSGPATAAHIHFGGPEEAGPIVLDFAPDLTSPIDRTFTAEDYPSSPPEGVPEDFEGFAVAVRQGQTYINVHTDNCPPGEIRGQIE